MAVGSIAINHFNALTSGQQHHALLSVCSSRAWVDGMLAEIPFHDGQSVLQLADRVLATLTESELDAALAGHPRIGARPDNPSSALEQAGVDQADSAVLVELARGNQAYEDKFGYVYLVCASGRSAESLLQILTERLDNDPVVERAVMRAELGKINRLRLQRLLCEA